MSDHHKINFRLASAMSQARAGAQACGLLILLGSSGLAQATLPAGIAVSVDNATGLSAGDALIATCASGRNAGNQFQDDCDAIFGSPGDVAANAVNQVAADQVSAQNAAATRQFRTNLGAVGGRLAQIRLADQLGIDEGISIVQGDEMLGFSGGGASADGGIGQLGGFLTFKYRTGDHDDTSYQPGFDFDGWGAVGGIDYRFSDDMVGGVALSYMQDEVDFDSSRGDLESDAWGVTLYGTWYRDDALFIDGMLGYGWSEMDLDRNLTYLALGQNVNQVASSDTDGELLSASIGGGYNIVRGSTTFTPVARLDYARNEVDGFTESMSNPTAAGGTMVVRMEDATYKSLTSRLGIQVGHSISHAGGVVLPSIQLDWVHEFENDQEKVRGQYIADVLPGGTPFLVFTDKPDRDYFDLQVAVSGQFADGMSGFVSYNTLLGFDDLTYHAVNAGVRMEF